METRIRRWGGWRVAAVPALLLLLISPLFVSSHPAGAAATGPRTLSADLVPAAVRDGSAPLLGAHAPGDTLQVLFMLPMRDWAGLNAFLADAGNPKSPNYTHYLTEEQVTARFGPEAAHADHVVAWLHAAGITDLRTPADRLYVEAKAPAAAFSRLLGVKINDYRGADHIFFAPDRPPTLPAAVSADVDTILGLDNAVLYHTDSVRGGKTAGRPASFPPYYPQDFAAAYDVMPFWQAGHTGGSVHIAITLWSLPPSDATLNGWSQTTGSPVATRANGRLEIILTDGTPSTDTDDGEAALDIESSGGLAPAVHLRYYEATQPTNSDLAVALDQAGADPANLLISNSWGGPEGSNGRDAIDHILAAHTASGHDYLFSSGDNGSWAANHDPYPDYPTSSAYATSVGGTAFAGDINGAWPGETTWVYDPTGNNGNPEGSGGGFSLFAPRPAWQVAPGVTGNMRGYPDIAAVADPNTGMYWCSDSAGCGGIGGTSLAAPVWAGMMAVLDEDLVAHGGSRLGFANPTLYALAANAQRVPPYHDIVEGTNGAYNAGPGWDAVTGLGSPDLANIATDLAPAPPTPTATFVPGQHFSDVPPTNAFYTQINWCYEHGIISGYGDQTFRPNNNSTRGQVSKIETAAAGWSIDTSGGPHFTDIAGNPFYPFIMTAWHHGVINGYADGSFRPNNNITRGQYTKVLVLAKAWAIDTSGGPHFTDDVSSPFYVFIETAYHHQVISGYADGTFRPNNNITRAQLAKLIYGAYSSTPAPTATPARPTATRVPPTATRVPPSATRTPVGATATSTPCAGQNLIQNPGFETGTFPPWTIDGNTNPPQIVVGGVHSGTYAGYVGSLPGSVTEPDGDSSFYQQVVVPASGGTLSFWYYPFTTDQLPYDYQDVYITNTSGTILATILHVAENDQVWKLVTFDMGAYAGQTVRVKFLVHQDGSSDPTGMGIDDVSLTGHGCAARP